MGFKTFKCFLIYDFSGRSAHGSCRSSLRFYSSLEFSRRSLFVMPSCKQILSHKTQRHTSTPTQVEITDDLECESTVSSPYVETIGDAPKPDEEFSIAENGAKEAQTKTKARKKKTKNPLPSQTIDGRQLTFVEEIKVFAEMDALIQLGRVREY